MSTFLIRLAVFLLETAAVLGGVAIIGSIFLYLTLRDWDRITREEEERK